MPETASKLPEEDRPQMGLEALRNREGATTGTSGGQSQPGGGRNQSSGSTSTTGSNNNPSNLSMGGKAPETASDEDNDEGDDEGFFNKEGDQKGIRGRLRRGKDRRNKFGRGLSRRQKWIAVGLAVVGGGAISLSAFFFLGIFDLQNFMKNVEQAGFQRYQVDLNGRSGKWLQAYMELRFGEIDDPNLAPKDRDNLFFKSDKVSTNKPLTDWYRTLRASKFEQDLFEKQGIRFTSIAYKENGIIKYRAGVISFQNTDERITFDPGQATFDAMARGDPNAFNGALRDFVNVDQKFETDKQARAAIKTVVRDHYPQWWKGVKRFHLRHDIQNMIGVRSWTFWESQTSKWSEKKISIRNKILTSALPEDSKSGAFIKCLFGVPDCQASSDPANPAASELPADGTQKEGDKTNGDPNNPQPVGDGSGEATLADGATTAAAAGDTAGKILSKLVDKAGLLSVLDSLSRFDAAMNSHTLTKIITQAKTAQYAGLFTVFGVAADQLTTGQANSAEVNSFMGKFANPTNSEGWQTVVNPGSETTKESQDKKTDCSAKNQADMEKNPQQADKQFQYFCPQQMIGGPDNAATLQDAWNNGPGLILHPFLAAFHAATGGLFDVFNEVTGFITGAAENAVLSALGLQDDVQHVVASAAQSALQFGGATIGLDNNSPSGQVANGVIAGAGAMNEASMRDQGAAATTPTTAALANSNDVAYQADQAHTSFANRYLAVSNPKSLLSTQLFALANARYSGLGQDMVSMLGSLLSMPAKLLSLPVHADNSVPNGYAVDKFAGIDNTFDFPAQCLNTPALQMTPQNSTNAVQLGIFKPSELNWDLMTNKDDWDKALYAKVGNNENLAMQVYNCALLDNTVRGGIGAQYGDPGVDAYQSGGDSGSGGSTPGGGSPAPTTPGGFTNPFPGGWVPNRLDMGYDGTFKGQIVAPFDGTVTYAGSFTGWNGSSGVIIQADQNVGLPTKSLYFTEGVAPIASLQGKHVTAGTPIANATASPYGDAYAQGSAVGGIEWGVMENGNVGQFVDTEAVALGNCSSAAKSMVLSFSQWAQQKLGVAPPATTDHAGCA